MGRDLRLRSAHRPAEGPKFHPQIPQKTEEQRQATAIPALESRRGITGSCLQSVELKLGVHQPHLNMM